MKFDLVHFCIRKAVDRFGGKDKVFNGANFAVAFKEVCGTESTLDGKEVSAILCGRADVEILSGGSHYKLIES
jgi:hypothetical protein